MKIITVSLSLLFIFLVLPQQDATANTDSLRSARYATLDYDVVYVRCPRGRDIKWQDGSDLLNWNGVNDIWLSASNNVYQQPGCDLVLHHSAASYQGLPQGDPGREEVLVDCDETDNTAEICTIADPNVSFDGRYVVYTKFTDTRTFVSNTGIFRDGGLGPKPYHNQSIVSLYPDGDSPNKSSPYANRGAPTLKGYSAPALVFIYDLQAGTERQVSPAATMFSGLAFPGRDPEWVSNVPVMDTGPYFLPDGRIGFTSNRQSGFYHFQLFAMDLDGKNLTLNGHRAMNQQLHPITLKDGRTAYTSHDVMLQKTANNQYSLFTINPDGSDPFILAGKFDASQKSWHFITQLSDGDVVSTIYYNHNNSGMGSLRRFPIDPPGADFVNLGGDQGVWKSGASYKAFARVGESALTPEAKETDAAMGPYTDPLDFWVHPSRSPSGVKKTINGVDYFVDKATISMMGRYSHPAAAPDNDLLVTYTIGASSTMGGYKSKDIATILEQIGKDAGLWLIPLEPNMKPKDSSSTRQVGHIADDGLIIVDFPEYHEIMPRAVVTYRKIYGINRPGLLDDQGTESEYVQPLKNMGGDDRLPVGSPFALSGASSLYDRETRAMNGVPWNMKDGGGTMSGRTYTNIATGGADLAIFDNDEVYGIRVLMPVPGTTQDFYPTTNASPYWAGQQRHHLRILGEFPVRKPDGTPEDPQGNPDTSFIVKLPADTPFLFQSLDKRGMALDIETTSRSMVRGEQQLCIGCHVHTREDSRMDPYSSVAKVDTGAPFGDFTGPSALLFDGFNADGSPSVAEARSIYSESLAPGVNSRRSFAVEWEKGVSDIFQNRCASCHAEGKPAQQLTGLRLDGDDRTYQLLIKNGYTREDGTKISHKYLPGDGLDDVVAGTPGTDRITPRYQCCLASRWMSLNSARSSMLIWALYGERMDGRNPETGLPWGAAGEAIPANIPQGLRGVLVDNLGRENPEVWPKVAEHAAYVSDMPESEKRMLARWIDLGAPKRNIHDDTMRPVLTITPELTSGSVSRVYVGLWDDSPLDYSRFSVTRDDTDITPAVPETPPDTVLVDLGVTITQENADSVSFSFEIWDKPDRTNSYKSPDTPAANRSRMTLTGRGLLRMVNATPNVAPRSASAVITTTADTASSGVFPAIDDPDRGDSHIIRITTQPTDGRATVTNNRLVYTPDAGFVGDDSFTFEAKDLGGLSVTGTATVTVIVPPNRAPTATSAIIVAVSGVASFGVTPAVFDPDKGDTHSFAIITQPQDGRASIVANQLVYVSNEGFVGDDSFTFSATDQDGLSVTDSAVVTVKAPVINNAAPTSAQATIKTVQGQSSVGVTPIVSDPNSGDIYRFSIAIPPKNGVAEVVNGQLVYTPTGEFFGSDSFTFMAKDLGGLSVEGVAKVTVAELGDGVSVVGSGGSSSGGAMGIPEILGFLVALLFRRFSRRAPQFLGH